MKGKLREAARSCGTMHASDCPRERALRAAIAGSCSQVGGVHGVNQTNRRREERRREERQEAGVDEEKI